MVQKLYEASEGVGDSQDLDKSQVSTLKMLFFDCLSERCSRRLSDGLCKKSKSHRQFDDGIVSYLKEVDIVNVLFELRSLKAIKKALLVEMPHLKQKVKKQRRKTFVIERTQQIQLEDSSDQSGPFRASNESISSHNGSQQPQSHQSASHISDEITIGDLEFLERAYGQASERRKEF